MRQRRLEGEVMDDPALDAPAHERALRGLARLNRISGSARTVWAGLRDPASAADRAFRVLDVATGGGDVPIALHRLGERAGVRLRVEGCDRSEVALGHARRAAERAGAPIRFFPLDALNDSIPTGYDAVVCSLFLHHLTDEEAAELLRKMADAAGRRVVVNDLHRSRLGLWAVRLGAALLTRSPVVRIDGPRSVRAAFTPAETRKLARRAGLERGVELRRRGPLRWVMTWDRTDEIPR
jgi:2-polyprenyl-3-methyl-5-hydroxy-6-metoxy-1,4-benzoquinol methylase